MASGIQPVVGKSSIGYHCLLSLSYFAKVCIYTRLCFTEVPQMAAE